MRAPSFRNELATRARSALSDVHAVQMMAQPGDFQRIGGGFVQQAPSVDAQLRAAKQRVHELDDQLEQRTRQLTAVHATLAAENSARLTCSAQNEQLGRRLTELTGERERMAIQMTQWRERAQTAEAMVGQPDLTLTLPLTRT